MLIAAVAVSVGCVPVVVPSAVALVNNIVHADPVPFEFTHAARIFASVLISACGTVPFPAGVVAGATPVEIVSRFVAFANAFAIPVSASVVPELPTCVASVANPAIAYAAATVDTSFTTMYEIGDVPERKFPPVGQLPSAAINPAAAFAPVPSPGSPPSAYKYTCCPAVHV
jgi:hypothetical protein